MAKGKSKRTLLGIQGVVGHKETPDWSFIYEVSKIRDPKWNIGDLVETPDGRKFRYCLSYDACDTFKANVFFNSLGTRAQDVGVDWSALVKAAAIGDKSVVVTLPSTRDVAADSLRGGLILLSIATGGDNATNQQRLIVGNTAGVASGTMTVYLDAGLVSDLTTSSYMRLMPSPYSAVTKTAINAIEGGAGKGRVSFVGYAAAPVNAANLYHWEQTAGQIAASHHGVAGAVVGEQQYKREVVFRYDGNLIHRGATTGITGLEAQTAGYIMDNNTDDNGAKVFMLTGLES